MKLACQSRIEIANQRTKRIKQVYNRDRMSYVFKIPNILCHYGLHLRIVNKKYQGIKGYQKLKYYTKVLLYGNQNDFTIETAMSCVSENAKHPLLPWTTYMRPAKIPRDQRPFKTQHQFIVALLLVYKTRNAQSNYRITVDSCNHIQQQPTCTAHYRHPYKINKLYYFIVKIPH